LDESADTPRTPSTPGLGATDADTCAPPRDVTMEGDAAPLSEQTTAIEGQQVEPTTVDVQRANVAAPPRPSQPRAPRPRLAPHHLVLGVILLVGAALRYYGLNWDLGSGLHPDERHVTGLVQGLSLPSSLSQFLSPGHVSPLEPGDFAYGSLPIYLYWIVGHVATWLGSWVPGLGSWRDALGPGVYITGRTVSAAAGVATILVVYLIGHRAYNRAIGLLTAAFFALCALDLQLSHFLTVDTLTTLFVTLAVYQCVRLTQDRRPRDFVWAGIWTGAALACKVSVVELPALLVVAPFLRSVASRQARIRVETDTVVQGWDRLRWLIVAGAAAVAVFFIAQPYALIDHAKYWSDVIGQARLASGQDHAPYTDKFYNTPPFWYHIENIVPWELGWPLGLAAMAGVIAATWRSVGALIAMARRAVAPRAAAEIVVVGWTLAYFLATGGQFMKYLRYMLPIMPELCLLGAVALVPTAAWAARHVRAPRWQPALAVGVLALTFLYALAYDNIYSTLNTRLQASSWFVHTVKPGTPYTTEAPWDETIPWNYAGLQVPPGYNGASLMTTSGGDTLQTWTGGAPTGAPTPGSLADNLARARYVTIFSDRIVGTVPHLPGSFPYSSRYYCLLFGQHPPAAFHCPRSTAPDPLGFRQVKYFYNHPNLFGLSLDDYPADQNFSEYDHPPVWIFARVRPVSPAQTAALVTDNGRVTVAAARAAVATPSKSLLLTRQELAANAAGPSYAQEFPANGLPMRAPALVWIFWVEVLGLLALPLSLRLFRRLPDRGVVLAKTVGLLLTGYLTWIAASLHLLRFTHATILGAAVVVGAASLLWGLPPREVGAFLRSRGRALLTVEAVFLVGFVAAVVMRMAYPDLWNINDGGEKEMDFSYLNGVVRSQTMPPADPWFGGGYLNYYYYGYYLVATLIKLTGVAPNIAYNLAVPTLFALTLASAYTLGYALTRRIGIGLLAAAFVALAGNLFIGAHLVATLIGVSPIQSSFPLLGGVVGLAGGLWHVLARHQTFPAIGFRAGPFGAPSNFGWDSTRVIGQGSTINEFPFFSFLYADLHAHLMDLFIMLAAIALAANAALGAWPWLAREGHNGQGGATLTTSGRTLLPGAGLVMLLVTAVIVGATGPTNTWDLPTALIIVALGIGLNVYARRSRRSPVRRAVLALVAAAASGALLYVLTAGILYYPFYSHLQALYSAIPAVKLAHTALDQFLTVWGLFLFILVSYVAADLWRGAVGRWARCQTRAAQFVLFYWPRRERVRRLLRIAYHQRFMAGRADAPPAFGLGSLAAGVVLALLALVIGMPVLSLALLLLGATLSAVLAPDGARANVVEPRTALAGRVRLVVLGMTFLALGLTAVCEVAFLADFNAGDPNTYRMNTVFKLYEQAWLLFAVASAAALAALIRARRPLSPAPRPSMALGIVATGARPSIGGERSDVMERTVSTAPPWKRWWSIALLVLLIAVALYPITETAPRLQQDRVSSGAPALGATLDGTAFVRVVFPGEYRALSWLNATVKGDPTVLSSDNAFYNNFRFRVPWMTGLPDVVNGNWEAGQQRYSGQTAPGHTPPRPYPDEIGPRSADVATIYNTTDAALALQLLHKYHVAFVYVGVTEHGQNMPNPPSGCFTYGSSFNPGNQGCVGYPPEGLAKFDAMSRPRGPLKRVYNADGVQIYRVVA